MLPAVPVVVLDAIQHWSQELDRVHFVDATCFRFRNLRRYEECRALLESRGWIVAASWHHVSSLPEIEQGYVYDGCLRASLSSLRIFAEVLRKAKDS